MRDQSLYLDAHYLRQSDLAVCFQVEGAEVWIPKSLIETISIPVEDLVDDMVAPEVQFSVPAWFARKEGLE